MFAVKQQQIKEGIFSLFFLSLHKQKKFKDVQDSSVKGIEGEALGNEYIGNHHPHK